MDKLNQHIDATGHEAKSADIIQAWEDAQKELADAEANFDSDELEVAKVNMVMATFRLQALENRNNPKPLQERIVAEKKARAHRYQAFVEKKKQERQAKKAAKLANAPPA